MATYYNNLDHIRFHFASQVVLLKHLQDAFQIVRNVIDGYNNKMVNKRLIEKLNMDIKETHCYCHLNKRSDTLLFLDIRCKDFHSYTYQNATYYVDYDSYSFKLISIDKRLVANETALEVEATIERITNFIERLTDEAIHLDELWYEFKRIKEEKEFFQKKISYPLSKFFCF